MAQKPSIPKGTRDFNPKEVTQRNYIFSIITNQFKQFGFLPIETPSFENSQTLLGKYGEEGDRLLFKILNSGDFLSKVSPELYAQKNSATLASKISEKALRYDLTVPFARYVVQHQNEITFPFKRYQIQPVWRADRPQRGRFREFYQCDADVVGSTSLWQEVSCILLYDAVFNALQLQGVTIKINHRKLLAAIAEIIGASDKLIDFTVALDKLDKIGIAKVKEEMLEKGITTESIAKLEPLFTLKGNFNEQIEKLKQFLNSSEKGQEGIQELSFIEKQISQLGLQASALELDVTLARGLNYYTGAIFEVLAPKEVQLGAIGGGGRYDNLTEIFGLKAVSGIGISFGLDRIYLVLEELQKFPKALRTSVDVLFINFGETEALYSMKAIKKLRENKIAAELYPDATKLKKQMSYANKLNIPYVVMVGEEEIKHNTYTLKNMKTGEQVRTTLEKIIPTIQQKTV